MIMSKLMSKRDKIRAQMKSRFYYWFWGAATVAVVGGQLYVGSSYRAMAKSMNRWFDTAVDALIDILHQQIFVLPLLQKCKHPRTNNTDTI